MPKKAYLANYYRVSEELKQKYLKTQDAVESRRWHLLGKISLGWTIKNSAIAVGMNYDYEERNRQEIQLFRSQRAGKSEK